MQYLNHVFVFKISLIFVLIYLSQKIPFLFILFLHKTNVY